MRHVQPLDILSAGAGGCHAAVIPKRAQVATNGCVDLVTRDAEIGEFTVAEGGEVVRSSPRSDRSLQACQNHSDEHRALPSG